MASSNTASPRTTKSRSTKNREEMVADHASAFGAAYLKKAAAKVGEASTELVEWSKDHPVKAAAAGAALIAVTATIYATMRSLKKPKGGARSKK
ncbi:MAG: hypothetical protein H0V44_08790 [Planctomycetes bacterium]|nr:hypothetical protein [Planctomycetota bacterium]